MMFFLSNLIFSVVPKNVKVTVGCIVVIGNSSIGSIGSGCGSTSGIGATSTNGIGFGLGLTGVGSSFGTTTGGTFSSFGFGVIGFGVKASHLPLIYSANFSLRLRLNSSNSFRRCSLKESNALVFFY